MTTTATTSGVPAGRQPIRAELPTSAQGPPAGSSERRLVVGRHGSTLAIGLVAVLTTWVVVPTLGAVTVVAALVGVFLVGPGLAHAVERWIARRVVTPLFLGFVPPASTTRGVRSRCARCEAPLAPGLLPAIPWTATAGRCRCCGNRLPGWGAVVDWSAGGLFLICGVRFGLSWGLWPASAFAAGGVAVSAVDLRTRRIPTSFVGATAGMCGGLIVCWSIVLDRPGAIVGAVVGACMAGGLFLVLHLVSPAGLGLGDVRYAALVGLMAGWAGWSPDDAVADSAGAALAAVFVATVVALTCHAIVGSRSRQLTPLPFAPALTFGALVIIWSAP